MNPFKSFYFDLKGIFTSLLDLREIDMRKKNLHCCFTKINTKKCSLCCTKISMNKVFCKYQTSIKIKISMTCVYKEYEVKIKMAQEQLLQLKMKFLLGFNMKTVIWWTE